MNLTQTIAVGTILAASATASAALVRLNLEPHAVDGDGLVPGTTTYRLYAEFDDLNDQLTSVYSSIPWITHIIAPQGFYQNDFTGPTIASVNAAFWAMIPSISYDSWITIGGEWSHDSGTLSTTNLGNTFSYFEDETNVPGVLAFLFGEWVRPVNDQYAFGQTVVGLPNYQVLVGQFTTNGYGQSAAPWGRLNLRGYSLNFGFNGGQLVEWTVHDLEFGERPSTAGACCIESNCEIFEESTCTQVGGIWQGEGTSCDEVQCGEVPIGACCYPHASFGMVCEVLSQDDCVAASGFWYGDGSICSDIFVECDPLPGGGACCYDHAVYGMVCEVMSSEDCDVLPLGFFYGDGSVCSDDFVECPTLPGLGACCYETATQEMICEMMTEAECVDLSGYWYGSGVTCDDPMIECEPLPIGACCIEEGQNTGNWVCIETTIEHCQSNSGIWYGVGTLCSDSGIDCNVSHNCSVVPGSECARAPQYTDDNYQIFGEGSVAVQTVSPSMSGDRMLTVFDLSGLDTAPLNAPFTLNRYAHPDWNAANLGSIFGLAIDEDGNIFVTASQTSNTDIMGPSGWGAVYRIDTHTAAISTFAVLPTSGSSLGSITYDCVHNQFFVSSFEDGQIYRIDHDSGAILGSFDHGAPWSGNPGPVALGDRPFGLEVNGEQLYYALWNEDMFNASTLTQNEIWSVRLDGVGMPVAGSEKLEIVLPDFHYYGNELYSSPVADIDFSPTGTMLLGERTQGDITTLIATHSRVLEYECVDGTWMLTSHVFNIGENYVSYANAAGGVDATETNVWASADAMRLQPGELMWGIQGLPASGGTVADSWLIDYNNGIADGEYPGLGDLVIAPEGDGSGGEDPECPTIAAVSILCVNNAPPEFAIEFSIHNADTVDTITGITLSAPSGFTFTPANATLSVPPNADAVFSTYLTGGTPGQYICVDIDTQFESGVSCSDAVCFTLPECVIITDPPGDFNDDGLVSVDDLMILIGWWGEDCDGQGGDCDVIDADGSGVIDLGDLLIVLENWS